MFSSQPGVPKSRFAYLFPSKHAALIQVRLRPDLTDAEKRRAIDLIEQAANARPFAPQHGARYIVTGVPVVANALADAVQSAIFVLLGRRPAADGGHARRSSSAAACACSRSASRWPPRR